MNVNQILDAIEDMLDDGWRVPLSGGKCVLNVEQLRRLTSDIRLNLPPEIKQSQLIVMDRQHILDDAKKEAHHIVQVAEERARHMVNDNLIIKQAKEQAQETITSAQLQAKELKRAANDFSENLLQVTETSLSESIRQIKSARKALRNPVPGSGHQSNESSVNKT